MIYDKYIELCKELGFKPSRLQYLEYKYHILTRLYARII